MLPRPPRRAGVGRQGSPVVVRLQPDAAAAPVHLGASPAGHGALRRPPSAPRPGRSGHGTGPPGARRQVGRAAERGRERSARGREALAPPTPQNFGGARGGEGARPAGARSRGVRRQAPRGGSPNMADPAGSQSVGRTVPGRGRWHLRPIRARRGRHLGQSPGDPAAAAQWRGAGTLPVGRGAVHLRPMGARVARLCPATPGGSGGPGLRQQPPCAFPSVQWAPVPAIPTWGLRAATPRELGNANFRV